LRSCQLLKLLGLFLLVLLSCRQNSRLRDPLVVPETN
jgi:hypothetical protein